MKKLSRIAALLAAGALLFGAAGCSGGGSGSGDGDGDGSGGGGGGGSTVSENTVKGTYTVKDADLAGETLVFDAGKIYMRMDVLADEDEDSDDSDASAEKVTYNLTYVSGETAHTPSYTIEEASDEEGELYQKVGEAMNSGATSYIVYIEAGTYAIANNKVTGKMIVDEDTSFPVTADTDDAGHLKSFTVSFSGGSSSGDGTVDAVWTFKGVTFGEGTLAGFGSKLSADVEIAPTSGTGAKLTAVKGSTFKSDDSSNKRGLKTDASKKVTTAITDVTFEVAGIGSTSASSQIKGALKLELSADATVVIKGSVTGEADVRYILLAGADEEIIAIVPETKGVTAEQTIEENLTAGTYYIGIDGSVLASVECK